MCWLSSVGQRSADFYLYVLILLCLVQTVPYSKPSWFSENWFWICDWQTDWVADASVLTKQIKKRRLIFLCSDLPINEDESDVYYMSDFHSNFWGKNPWDWHFYGLCSTWWFWLQYLMLVHQSLQGIFQTKKNKIISYKNPQIATPMKYCQAELQLAPASTPTWELS